MNKKIVVIPKDKAVFWLDTNGRWKNTSGRIHNPKINCHFHASIKSDEDGYYLFHEHDDYVEKVYFPYEDTALFVNDVLLKSEPILICNTGMQVPLLPENLFIQNDFLYLQHEGHRIKFTENALVRLSRILTFQNDTAYIVLNKQNYKISSF